MSAAPWRRFGAHRAAGRGRRVAAELERLLREATERPKPCCAPVLLDHPAIRSNGPALRELASALRAGPPAGQGVELAEALLTHPRSPIYRDAPPGALEQALSLARAAAARQG